MHGGCVQASGDVSIAVLQGDSGGDITYTAGCNNAACTWPRTDTATLPIGAGCAAVSIQFDDAGATNKWLKVDARRTSRQCKGDPEYPSCNTNSRRLAALPGDDDHLPEHTLESLSDADDDGSGFRRALLQTGTDTGALTDEEQAEEQRADEESGPMCETNSSDEENADVNDIDEVVDISCSVFEVRFPGAVVLPELLPCSTLGHLGSLVSCASRV